ncbi:MAG: hypothetical protein C6Y22_13535 [Hapalosiphonaceae cyanobacterium JJU2]|nr:MAG: hypothetical protein C6Y22_13535 [Hapalosiphonaceae cyanobacterium JJU2]
MDFGFWILDFRFWIDSDLKKRCKGKGNREQTKGKGNEKYSSLSSLSSLSPLSPTFLHSPLHR